MSRRLPGVITAPPDLTPNICGYHLVRMPPHLARMFQFCRCAISQMTHWIWRLLACHTSRSGRGGAFGCVAGRGWCGDCSPCRRRIRVHSCGRPRRPSTSPALTTRGGPFQILVKVHESRHVTLLSCDVAGVSAVPDLDLPDGPGGRRLAAAADWQGHRWHGECRAGAWLGRIRCRARWPARPPPR